MKIAIRKGVFETNSSSTHSLVINKSGKTPEELFDIMNKYIQERYVYYGSFLDGEKLSEKQEDIYRNELLRDYPSFPEGVCGDDNKKSYQAYKIWEKYFTYCSGEGGVLEIEEPFFKTLHKRYAYDIFVKKQKQNRKNMKDGYKSYIDKLRKQWTKNYRRNDNYETELARIQKYEMAKCNDNIYNDITYERWCEIFEPLATGEYESMIDIQIDYGFQPVRKIFPEIGIEEHDMDEDDIFSLHMAEYIKELGYNDTWDFVYDIQDEIRNSKEIDD